MPGSETAANVYICYCLTPSFQISSNSEASFVQCMLETKPGPQWRCWAWAWVCVRRGGWGLGLVGEATQCENEAGPRPRGWRVRKPEL